jgi:hypothetical protein
MDMDGATVRVVSRRMVRPSSSSPQQNVNNNEVIHLTPWDLRLISIEYIKKGIVLPKPPAAPVCGGDVLVDALASSFPRALGRFYPFAGRIIAEEHVGDGTVTLSLRCTGEGAEFVHAVAPGVAVADIASALYTPPLVSAFYPLDDGVVGADAALESLPLVAVQVTELADGVFVGVSVNHSAGDGASLWHFFNTWSEIHRCGGVSDNLSTPAPFFKRWFVETSPVPIPLPFRKLQDIVRRVAHRVTVHDECFFTFSAASVEKLRTRANGESPGMDTTAISSLHAVLAHLWRAVCRARLLSPEQSTFYTLVMGYRGRVDGIPPGYVGNAMVFGRAEAKAGDIQKNGLGWAARLLTGAAAAPFDKAGIKESLERWVREPAFTYMVGDPSSSGGAGLVSGVRDLAALDVFGNDFGWGKPVAVRSGPGNKADGKVTVFEGPQRGGSISLEVCIAPDALTRLVADEEFMAAVTMPLA